MCQALSEEGSIWVHLTQPNPNYKEKEAVPKRLVVLLLKQVWLLQPLPHYQRCEKVTWLDPYSESRLSDVCLFRCLKLWRRCPLLAYKRCCLGTVAPASATQSADSWDIFTRERPIEFNFSWEIWEWEVWVGPIFYELADINKRGWVIVHWDRVDRDRVF